MDKQASLKQITETFEQGIEEVLQADLKQFVVVMADDGTPARSNGREIRLFGGPIFSSAFSADALTVEAELNRQLERNGSQSRMRVEVAAAWKLRRVAKLREMIATIGEKFAG